MQRGESRLEVVNTRRGGVRAFLRWLLLCGWLLAQVTLLAAFAAYVHFSRDLPPLDALVDYRPAQTTRVLTADGFLLAELAREHRTVLAAEEIPLRVRQAFLAAEDADFYRHGGIDLPGVMRAAWAMLQGEGRPRQGGSTITQQLAKALIGHEKTLVRKAREAVLARRLEAVLTKDQILWTYLNHVYLGRDAYGAAAAARAYFGRPLAKLSLGELAYLAGLPQRPSWLNRHPDAALARQRYVLDQLVARGWATESERQAALAAGVRLVPRRDLALWRAPYAAEAARRLLTQRLGEEQSYAGGLRVETTIRLADQQAAQEELAAGLEAIDRRQGWRGPLVRLAPAAAAGLQRAWAEGRDFVPGADGLRPALVQQVSRTEALLHVGQTTATLHLADCTWARPYDEQATDNQGKLTDLRQALQPGDVVVVRVAGAESASPRPDPSPPEVDLVPFGPAGVQGAVLLREAGTGYLRALVGGRDADLSVFDRTHQACRQPGSVFKPVYYSAALGRGFTPATVLTDAPFKVEQAGSIFAYRARNADRSFRGDMILADALAQSRNIPSLKVFRYVGAAEVVQWARGLGVESPLALADALALGASCVKPAEMVGVYALFADHGLKRPEVLVRRITDAAGKVLLDQRHPSDDRLDAADALRLTFSYEPPRPAPALTPQVAHLTAALLRGVVERGTAAAARKLTHPVAGKTGTTDSYDAWFIGFSAQRIAGVWVGPDENRRVLGKGEHGGKVALPIFIRLMERVGGSLPVRDVPGEPPPGVELVAVDPRSGAAVRPGSSALLLPFLAGTAPEEQVQGPGGTPGELDPDRLGGRF